MAPLPDGWVYADLGDLVTPSKERFNPVNNENRRFIGLAHIESGTGSIIGKGNSSETKSLKSVFSSGDILYGRLRPYLNKVTVPQFDGVCSTDVLVFPQNRFMSSKYISLYLLTLPFVQYATQNMSGVQHPRVKFETLALFSIPVAPLNEQVRIVSRVEEFFSWLDAGVRSLQAAKTQLEKYRQITLKRAYTGKLTKKWRQDNYSDLESALDVIKRKNLETKKKESLDMSDVPKKWHKCLMGNYVYFKGRIGWRGLKASEYTEEGPLLLSVYNLNYGKVVDLTNTYHVSIERYEESPEIMLQNNDILLVKDGSGIGKIGILKNLNEKATVNSSLLLIRPNKVFIPEFLFYQLKGPEMQSIVRDRITGTATPHLFQRDIKYFELMVAPIEEQKNIVQEIERIFSIIDQNEKMILTNLQSSKKFKQSILKKAFEGRLVPQNPSDKPASVLLENIKSQNVKQRKLM